MVALSWHFVLGFFVVSLGAAIVTTVIIWGKRRRFSLLYSLLIVAVLLFSCSVLSFFSFLRLNANAPLPQPVEETDVTDLAIRTSVDLPAVKDQSMQVNVSIFRRRQFPSNSMSPSQPTVELSPVGTPGVPIVRAFGPRYDVFAVAQLNASAFDVAPQEQPPQSLDQPSSVNFAWTVTPKYSGQQVLEVMVTGRWVTLGGGTPVERPLASQSLSVDVTDTSSPFISFGQLDVSQLLVVLLGSVLNVPWIIELVKRRQASGQKKATQTSHVGMSPSGTKKRGRKR